MKNILVSGDRFIDVYGRHIILNGVNMVFKGEPQEGTINYIPRWGEEDFKRLREWGFNVIRLGLIWNAVEPEPGAYDEGYLTWVKQMLDLCSKYQIYAYLDMHQDLFSVLFGNGAPKWATITDNLPHIEGNKWSDAYIFSEAVKQAFNNFWANTTAMDGKGIQDHYIDMWVHVASKFSKHPAVIGYDFMNEPHPGSAGESIFRALLSRFADFINKTEGANKTLEDMLEIFSQEDKMMESLSILEDKDVYVGIAKAAEPLVEEFDKGALGQFYNKISQAVRSVDADGIVMRENSYFSNMGIECKAEPILLENGEKDPAQVFSPHGYDLVVDTEATPYASNNRVDVIFDAHRRTQQNMGIPVLVGEWGAQYHYQEGLSHIEHLLSIFEKNLWSNTYWCYVDDFHKLPVLEVLKRPYPQAVCGHILSYKYDREGNVFHMEWEEEGCNAPSIIYIPTGSFKVEFDGAFHVRFIGNSRLIEIPPSGGRRRISIFIHNDY